MYLPMYHVHCPRVGSICLQVPTLSLLVKKLRQTLHQYNRFPLSQMTSVPTGIDLEKFSPQNKQQAREK